MTGKTYLVTGAAGFIGAAVAKRLVEDGNSVVTIDNLSTGYSTNIPNNVIFIKGDCSDTTIIDKLKEYRFDTVFHIAGQSSGESSFDDPLYDLKSNVLSTLLLLDYSKKHGCKKFIYGSTMSVYGIQPDVAVVEESVTNPISFYAVGKLASENYLKIYSSLGMTTVALRLFNAYGPGQNLGNLKQGMVSIFLAQAMEANHISVRGNADRYRDFVYIDDIVEAFILSNAKYSSGCHSLNVATGKRTTVKELIEKIKTFFPSLTVDYTESTPGDQFGIYGSPGKVQADLGYLINIELDQGLAKMIEWARNDVKKT